jgi:hypothetical protein
MVDSTHIERDDVNTSMMSMLCVDVLSEFNVKMFVCILATFTTSFDGIHKERGRGREEMERTVTLITILPLYSLL